MTLLSTALKDIEDWFRINNELLYNERDMQMHLAQYLRQTGNYHDVDLEYYVPNSEVKPDYIWKSELKLDIVLRRGNEYLPIELKYKTRTIRRAPIRFGEQLSSNVDITKTHSAQDLGRYDFWKDVRRLELVKRRFRNVVAGIAVFLTNDKSYLAERRPANADYNFSMNNGIHGPLRSWGQSAMADKHPGFSLDNSYDLKWQSYTIDNETFNALILAI